MSKLTIDAYSRQAITTLLGDHGLGSELTPTLLSQVFGLVGESGEVAEKFNVFGIIGVSCLKKTRRLSSRSLAIFCGILIQLHN